MSCEKKSDTTFEYTKSLVNKTDKVLFYFVRTTSGENSDFSYGNDSIGFFFVKHEQISLPPIGPYHISIEGVSMREEMLYNLTDTCFYQFNLNRTTWTEIDTLYWDNITYNVENGSNGWHELHFETLYFTDTLLSIMQKDYTMLHKFSEYYAK
jgi:hypothetical protein